MDKDKLRCLDVTEEMINHLEAEDIDGPFGYRCQAPFYWRSSLLAHEKITALWECGTVLSYFDIETGKFAQCSLEAIGDVRCEYSSLQGLLAELFIDEFEDETDTETLIEYAKLFGFLSIQRLLKEIELPKADYEVWRREFAMSCGG